MQISIARYDEVGLNWSFQSPSLIDMIYAIRRVFSILNKQFHYHENSSTVLVTQVLLCQAAAIISYYLNARVFRRQFYGDDDCVIRERSQTAAHARA